MERPSGMDMALSCTSSAIPSSFQSGHSRNLPFGQFRTRFNGFTVGAKSDSWGLEFNGAVKCAKIQRNGCVPALSLFSRTIIPHLWQSALKFYTIMKRRMKTNSPSRKAVRQPSDRCSCAWQISLTMSRKTTADGGAEISRGREGCFLVKCKSVACLFARQFCGSHEGDQGQGAAGKAASAKDGAGSSEGLMRLRTP